ncbi:hypothetical protein OF83DRAFT_1189471 [Amylostereum chailletii]|nr:hypothetical protein OF83DRAFT_1189471 [Amylostereum chailletii]
MQNTKGANCKETETDQCQNDKIDATLAISNTPPLPFTSSRHKILQRFSKRNKLSIKDTRRSRAMPSGRIRWSDIAESAQIRRVAILDDNDNERPPKTDHQCPSPPSSLRYPPLKLSDSLSNLAQRKNCPTLAGLPRTAVAFDIHSLVDQNKHRNPRRCNNREMLDEVVVSGAVDWSAAGRTDGKGLHFQGVLYVLASTSYSRSGAVFLTSNILIMIDHSVNLPSKPCPPSITNPDHIFRHLAQRRGSQMLALREKNIAREDTSTKLINIPGRTKTLVKIEDSLKLNDPFQLDHMLDDGVPSKLTVDSQGRSRRKRWVVSSTNVPRSSRPKMQQYV